MALRLSEGLGSRLTLRRRPRIDDFELLTREIGGEILLGTLREFLEVMTMATANAASMIVNVRLEPNPSANDDFAVALKKFLARDKPHLHQPPEAVECHRYLLDDPLLFCREPVR